MVKKKTVIINIGTNGAIGAIGAIGSVSEEKGISNGFTSKHYHSIIMKSEKEK
ncbi:hypothetical protein PIROE2DRAFT_18287 [Piromyces sp. E2]|nr:hypothetical protein PIROE2DRAFT_18287 [Piromyces sp. E2]|eukprot:OUM56898.1 hypothetical protein PIROE2DRAFT_18287 [Piromyces sp. E2]